MQNEKSYENLIKELGFCIRHKAFICNQDSILLLLNNNISVKKFLNLMALNISIEMLSQKEIYFLTKVFRQFVIDNNLEEKYSNFVFEDLQKTKRKSLVESLDVNNYFTSNEIRQFESEMQIDETMFDIEDKNTIIFDNVIKNSDGIYIVGSIPMRDIVELGKNNQFMYDINCQREEEKVFCRGEYYARPKVYTKSIKEMTTLMEDGMYIPTAITMNIPSVTGYENIEYNNELKQLKIVLDEHTSMFIIDGYHRYISGRNAMENCIAKNKPFDQMMMLNIFNISPARARDYIVQEAKKNAIDPSWLKVLTFDVINDICVNINANGDVRENPLKNRLGKDNKDVVLLGKLTTIEQFSSILKEYFKIDERDKKEQRKLTNFIKKFYSIIFSNCIEDLEDVKKSRKNNYKLNPNMFHAYNYILWKVYNLNNWEDVVFNILEKIDFRKEGILLDFGFDKKSLNKTNIEHLIKYIDNLYNKEID